VAGRVLIKQKALLTFAGMKILMVCLGNICRSPLAEGILESKVKKIGLDWEIDSAGTNNNYHIGEPPHPLSQKVAKLHAVDISSQCARAFETEDFDRFDKIYAMSRDILESMKKIAKKKFKSEKTDLLLNELYPGQNLDVPDPWYGEEPDYHEVFAMIDKACDKIIEKYGYLKSA
jgi:protein-tyrosine phosphatase